MVFRFGLFLAVFFFQAEDGIRDYKVTGVQTCALPIYGDRAVDGGFVNFFGFFAREGREQGPIQRDRLGARAFENDPDGGSVGDPGPVLGFGRLDGPDGHGHFGVDAGNRELFRLALQAEDEVDGASVLTGDGQVCVVSERHLAIGRKIYSYRWLSRFPVYYNLRRNLTGVGTNEIVDFDLNITNGAHAGALYGGLQRQRGELQANLLIANQEAGVRRALDLEFVSVAAGIIDEIDSAGVLTGDGERGGYLQGSLFEALDILRRLGGNFLLVDPPGSAGLDPALAGPNQWIDFDRYSLGPTVIDCLDKQELRKGGGIDGQRYGEAGVVGAGDVDGRTLGGSGPDCGETTEDGTKTHLDMILHQIGG